MNAGEENEVAMRHMKGMMMVLYIQTVVQGYLDRTIRLMSCASVEGNKSRSHLRQRRPVHLPNRSPPRNQNAAPHLWRRTWASEVLQKQWKIFPRKAGPGRELVLRVSSVI